MSMGRFAKYTLATVLVLAVFFLAYVRITDAIDDFEMQWMRTHTNSRIEQIVPEQPEPQPSEPQPQPPDPQPRPYPQDTLSRT